MGPRKRRPRDRITNKEEEEEEEDLSLSTSLYISPYMYVFKPRPYQIESERVRDRQIDSIWCVFPFFRFVFFFLSFYRTGMNFDGMELDHDDSVSELIILGSGCSSGVPSPRCLISPHRTPCIVCHKAIVPPLESNRNYRCNTSLLIKFRDDDGQRKFIQIDVGKNFKEQVLRWFIAYQIPRLDAVILTHEHADAILGLDDIRGVQPVNAYNRIEPMPVFLTKHSMASIKGKFSYLVNKVLKEGQEIRRVAQLDWKLIDHESSFQAAGLTFTPLPVKHGEDYTCLGFLFGRKQKVAYISDVSRFLETTEYAISKNGAGQVDLLILDSLYKNYVESVDELKTDFNFIAVTKAWNIHNPDYSVDVFDEPSKVGKHNTHFCLPESLAAVKRLQPKRALFVGMTHEFDHDLDNEHLKDWSKREGLDVQLAYDGLRIPIHL